MGAAVLALSIAGTSAAQYGTIQTNDGVSISIKTVTTPSGSNDRSFGNIYSSQSEGIVHRVMTDRKNKIYLGYDLSVERLGDSGQFRVTIRPLSKTPDALTKNSSGGTGAVQGSGEGGYSVSVGKNRTGAVQGSGVSMATGKSGSPDYTDYSPQSLQSYPDPVVIDDGDSISIDLLENPATGTKISDVITINYRGGQFGAIYSADSSAKDFTMDDLILRIEYPSIQVNEERFTSRAGVAGNVIWVYIPGKGRFVFSFVPQPGYGFTKTGVIEDKNIRFSLNGDVYNLTSKSTVLCYGGKWNLWVMHDADYTPDSSGINPSDLNLGGTSSVDLLFRAPMEMMEL